jgi:hypothetical protein
VNGVGILPSLVIELGMTMSDWDKYEHTWGKAP